MDTISDFVTRIRNAGLAKHEKVDVPASNSRVGIAKVLEEAGYIRSFKVARDGKQGVMRVYLKYDDGGKHMMSQVTRVSRPGRRVYVKALKIPQVRSGYGLCILSTNKGIMSGEKAAQMNLGGELLVEIW